LFFSAPQLKRGPLGSGEMVSAKEGSSFRMPPEEQRFFQLISDYQRGKLTLEEAVPLVREASHALRGPINMSMPPSVRRLFAEVAKLDGRTFPEHTPRPDRHEDGGGEMRHRLAESVWEALRSHPRSNQPLSIYFHFAASTEQTARAIATWLTDQGQERIEVESPAQADADDWIISASTPSLKWSQADAARWARVINGAPFADEASFTGWSV